MLRNFDGWVSRAGEHRKRRRRSGFQGREVNLSHAFAGQSVGVTQGGERIWLVTFMQCDLGYFDDENPFVNLVTEGSTSALP